MSFIRKTLPLLLFFFFLSVIIRLPNIERPLSKHHEFCTAISLRILQIWYESGITTYGCNPVMTYNTPADRYINNFASGSGQMMDAQGRYYYVSHPPLAYYVPFVIFKNVGIYPTIRAIQYFNMALHFLCAFGVYWIVCVLLKIDLLRQSSFAAFAAYLLYLFSPATLWFQSNTYMADMFVQLPFVYGVLAFLKEYRVVGSGYSDKKIGNRFFYPVLLCLFIFLTIYSSWLGIFFAATVTVYFLINAWQLQNSDKIQSQRSIYLAIILLLVAIAALGLIAFQYSRINGFDAYLQEAKQRAAERSINDLKSLPLMYFTIIENYCFNYLPLIGLIVLLIISGWKTFLGVLKPFRTFIVIAGLPVLLLHLILADYSGHDFTTLYAAPVLAVIAAILLQNNSTYFHNRQGLIGLVMMLGVIQYFFINLPGDNSQSGDRYDADRRAGIRIADKSNPNEVVFLLAVKPDPQIVFYAHRNIQQVANEHEAKAFLTAHKIKSGVLFLSGRNGVATSERKITVP